MFRAVRPTDPVLTRRALVATVSGSALALASCDLDPRSDDAETASPDAPVDPDLTALAEAVSAIAEASALVVATTTAHPALAVRLTGFGELHDVHRDALAGATDDLPEPTATPAPPTVITARPQALAAVRRAESSLATRLASWAQRAESGTFARLLAVMSAAVQQELLALDRDGGTG